MFLVTFFLFQMVISFMLPWKNLSHRALALVCAWCFTMQTQEKMKKLLQRFKLYFTVDKKKAVFFILNNYQFSQSLILNFIATFSRITVLHFSISEFFFIKVQFFSYTKYFQFNPFLKRTFICDKKITQNSSLKE